MTDLFEMLGTIARRRKGTEDLSPFATPKDTQKWLKSLPADSDYDTHHALVEGIERFNAENVNATLERMKSLIKLEEAGLPLQMRIVEQYVRNQASFRLARQALWRETWVFWSLLGEAWMVMLKQAYRNQASADLKPSIPEIAARALRYSGLVMRWEFHQSRSPAPSIWRRVHKIYRLIERDGLARNEVILNARATDCSREYTLLVLMGLVQPLGYRAQEIESIAQILDGYEPVPLPEIKPKRELHTHVVDLSMSEGACILDSEWVHGRRLRYFDLMPLVAHLRSLDSGDKAEAENGLTRQMASLIERGGIRRNRQRTQRFGRVWVATGMDNIMAALARPDSAKERPPLLPWMLRDESVEGMGFSLPENPNFPQGKLVAVSWDPAEGIWQLLAIRWQREEGGQHQLGTQRLSRHPKRVEIHAESDDGKTDSESTWAIFLPMTHTEQGVSNLLIPREHYQPGAMLALRDGEVIYRLRLGEVHETHENWVRVGMDVFGREVVAVAA